MTRPQLARPWGGASHFSDLDGPVHWVDVGGPAGVPPIVMVHVPSTSPDSGYHPLRADAGRTQVRTTKFEDNR